MKTIEYQFILKAKTEVAQARGVEGNASILNRIPQELDDGDVVEIPCISGTAIRHAMRTALSLTILDAVGLLGHNFDRPEPVRLLLSGGGNMGSGNTMKLDEMRQLESLVPSIRLFGGTSKNMPHRGHIEVGPAVLVCEERMDELEPWMAEALSGRDIKPAESYVGQSTNYPRDAVDSLEGEALLTDAAQTDELNRKIAREKATDDDDAEAAEEAKGGGRIYSSEYVRRGSLFTWDVVGHVDNELDEATLNAALVAFLRNPIVGKSRSVGWGRLSVYAAQHFDHLRPAQALQAITAAELTAPHRAAGLLEHIESRKDEVVACLKSLQ